MGDNAISLTVHLPPEQAAHINELSRLTGKSERDLVTGLIELGARYLLAELQVRKAVSDAAHHELLDCLATSTLSDLVAWVLGD